MTPDGRCRYGLAKRCHAERKTMPVVWQVDRQPRFRIDTSITQVVSASPFCHGMSALPFTRETLDEVVMDEPYSYVTRDFIYMDSYNYSKYTPYSITYGRDNYFSCLCGYLYDSHFEYVDFS